ncbi:MAG: DUF302 domain-containing protein [Candidatus Aquicultorales bacterium]
MDLAYRRMVAKTIRETEESLTEALKEGGFGVMTRVDVKERLAEKGVDFDRDIYLLGVCNPQKAKTALYINDSIALMLPCSIVLYERPDATEIALAKPSAVSSFFEGEGLEELAAEVEEKLRQAVDAA